LVLLLTLENMNFYFKREILDLGVDNVENIFDITVPLVTQCIL